MGGTAAHQTAMELGAVALKNDPRFAFLWTHPHDHYAGPCVVIRRGPDGIEGPWAIKRFAYLGSMGPDYGLIAKAGSVLGGQGAVERLANYNHYCRTGYFMETLVRLHAHAEVAARAQAITVPVPANAALRAAPARTLRDVFPDTPDADLEGRVTVHVHRTPNLGYTQTCTCSRGCTLARDPQADVKAYAYGVIAHTALDVNVHPYVNTMTGNYHGGHHEVPAQCDRTTCHERAGATSLEMTTHHLNNADQHKEGEFSQDLFSYARYHGGRKPWQDNACAWAMSLPKTTEVNRFDAGRGNFFRVPSFLRWAIKEAWLQANQVDFVDDVMVEHSYRQLVGALAALSVMSPVLAFGVDLDPDKLTASDLRGYVRSVGVPLLTAAAVPGLGSLIGALGDQELRGIVWQAMTGTPPIWPPAVMNLWLTNPYGQRYADCFDRGVRTAVQFWREAIACEPQLLADPSPRTGNGVRNVKQPPRAVAFREIDLDTGYFVDEGLTAASGALHLRNVWNMKFDQETLDLAGTALRLGNESFVEVVDSCTARTPPRRRLEVFSHDNRRLMEPYEFEPASILVNDHGQEVGITTYNYRWRVHVHPSNRRYVCYATRVFHRRGTAVREEEAVKWDMSRDTGSADQKPTGGTKPVSEYRAAFAPDWQNADFPRLFAPIITEAIWHGPTGSFGVAAGYRVTLNGFTAAQRRALRIRVRCGDEEVDAPTDKQREVARPDLIIIDGTFTPAVPRDAASDPGWFRKTYRLEASLPLAGEQIKLASGPLAVHGVRTIRIDARKKADQAAIALDSGKFPCIEQALGQWPEIELVAMGIGADGADVAPVQCRWQITRGASVLTAREEFFEGPTLALGIRSGPGVPRPAPGTTIGVTATVEGVPRPSAATVEVRSFPGLTLHYKYELNDPDIAVRGGEIAVDPAKDMLVLAAHAADASGRDLGPVEAAFRADPGFAFFAAPTGQPQGRIAIKLKEGRPHGRITALFGPDAVGTPRAEVRTIPGRAGSAPVTSIRLILSFAAPEARRTGIDAASGPRTVEVPVPANSSEARVTASVEGPASPSYEVGGDVARDESGSTPATVRLRVAAGAGGTVKASGDGLETPVATLRAVVQRPGLRIERQHSSGEWRALGAQDPVEARPDRPAKLRAVVLNGTAECQRLAADVTWSGAPTGWTLSATRGAEVTVTPARDDLGSAQVSATFGTATVAAMIRTTWS